MTVFENSNMIGEYFLIEVDIEIWSYFVRLTKSFWTIWGCWLRLVIFLMSLFYTVSGEPHTSLSDPFNIILWLRNQLLCRKPLINITKVNIQPKQQYKSIFFFKPFFWKGALTNHIKKAHNISMTTTKKEFMEIYSQKNLSDKNGKNGEIYKHEVEQAK